MSAEYRDRWIECTDDHVVIRAYYFPWGTKRIPYSRIRGVGRLQLGLASGKGRVWGTANPTYWFHLDPRRPSKDTALVLDLGRLVRPVITPDDPTAVETLIRERIGSPAKADTTNPAPVT